MARSYGRFTTSIWLDPDFTSLRLEEQGAYFTLGLQPDVSAAGVLPFTSRRWSKLSAGTSRDRIEEIVAMLSDCEGRHLVVDEDTEEVLIRKFMKWDMGWANTSKRMKVVLDAVDSIVSPKIQAAALHELWKIPESELGTVESRDALSRELKIRYPDYVDTVSRFDRVVVTTTPRTTSTPNPSEATRSPQAALPVPVSASPSRAARLPDGWRPGAVDVEWARANEFSDEFAKYETEKFIDYWRAKGGRDATKTDWSATWRNWLRRASEQAGTRASPNGRRPATTDQRALDAIALSERLKAAGE